MRAWLPTALVALAALALGWFVPQGEGGDLAVSAGLLALFALGLCLRARATSALALAAALHFVEPYAARWAIDGKVQAWNLFHYTTGARFFGELGYYDLYTGALAADRAGDDSLRDVGAVRDLHTYGITSRDAAPFDLGRLSPARLAELQRTVDTFEPMFGGRARHELFTDRGYNATPAYTAVAGPIAAVLSPLDPRTRFASTTLDLLLLLGGFAALLAACGAEATATVALVLLVFPGTENRLVGGFLEYDWLAALLVAAAAVRADRPVVAAGALSWAAASRVFPLVLAASLLLPAARRRTLDGFERRFLAAFALSGLAWLALGCATARGPAAWLEFVPRILFHAGMHARGEQRIGLAHLFTYAPGPSSDDVRQALLAAREPVERLVAAIGVAAWGWTASRRGRDEALQLGWIAVFVATVASRYYWAGAVVAAALGPAWALGALGVCVAGHAARAWGADDYHAYLALEAALAAALVAWIARQGARGAGSSITSST